jgi:DNA (cytosine-5)-methyltransferase 1
MTRNGQVYGRQTLAHRTTGSESSLSPIPEDSMLRTPSAIEGEGGAITEDQARAKNRMLQVRDQMAQLAAENGLKVSPGITAGLLPTPNTMDHLPARSAEKIAESKLRTPGGYANVRETVVNELLPTPRACEGTKQDTTVTAEQRRESGHQVHITHIAKSGVDDPTMWGKFAPAIERWEGILGRPAPAPTKPDGKDGAHRLSSQFTEWMMGLPEGWITDCGLTRNEELKACGNGVVPQQAALALSLLLERIGNEQKQG